MNKFSIIWFQFAAFFLHISQLNVLPHFAYTVIEIIISSVRGKEIVIWYATEDLKHDHFWLAYCYL